MLKWNGADLPVPNSISTGYTTVTKAKETLSGKTVRQVLRRKLVLSCSWDQLTSAELKTLLATETATSGTLTYWDEKTETFKTATVYAEDVNSSLQHAKKILPTKLQTVNKVTLSFKEF